jgi:hypothetical protein
MRDCGAAAEIKSDWPRAKSTMPDFSVALTRSLQGRRSEWALNIKAGAGGGAFAAPPPCLDQWVGVMVPK